MQYQNISLWVLLLVLIGCTNTPQQLGLEEMNIIFKTKVYIKKIVNNEIEIVDCATEKFRHTHRSNGLHSGSGIGRIVRSSQNDYRLTLRPSINVTVSEISLDFSFSGEFQGIKFREDFNNIKWGAEVASHPIISENGKWILELIIQPILVKNDN